MLPTEIATLPSFAADEKEDEEFHPLLRRFPKKNLTTPAADNGNADENDLGELDQEQAYDRQKAQLLGRHAANQRGEAIFRDMIGRSIEIFIAFSGLVFECRQNFPRMRLFPFQS